MIKSFLAALMMFTRLPLWRFVQVDKKYYTHILLYWPLVGFLTGLITWGILFLASFVLPPAVACILAVIGRLLLTGALHEDGLADFLDGFGGGQDKDRILRIMKDSYIGSYGTIGLIVYFLLYASLLYSLAPCTLSCLGIIVGADVFSKLLSAIMINTLPYARTEETSKTKLLYRKIRGIEFTLMFVFCTVIVGLLPGFPEILGGMLLALLTVFCLRLYLNYKIGGYTGDCCGAVFLLTELAFYLGTSVLLYLHLPPLLFHIQ